MSRQRLLATDMDGTFLGDDAAMGELWDAIDAAGIALAFSTGRHLPSIQAFYDEHHEPRRAAACVCMVGTEVWVWQDGRYERDDGWSRHISEAWDKGAVEAVLGSIPQARMQDAEWQSEFKSSYFLEEDAASLLAEIEQRLEDRGLRAKVVYSADRFLDLLPYRSGKGGAVAYTADLLGIPAAGVVTAGDTGNDLDMMRPELGFRSIAVGNATDELRRLDEPHVYHATAAHAAGIREGLVHYGWLPGVSLDSLPPEADA